MKEMWDPAWNTHGICAESTLKNLIIPAMMSMFSTLSQKFDEPEEQLGQEGSLMPAVEVAPGAGTMDHGHAGHGNGSNRNDLHVEEEGTLESQ